MKGEHRMRKAYRLLTAFVAALLALTLAAGTIVYAKCGFTYAYIRWLLICCAAGGILLCVLACAAKHGTEKQPASRSAQPYRDTEMNLRRKNMLRVIMLMAAVLLIVLGITNGGLWDVLVKAINICTECIGLG